MDSQERLDKLYAGLLSLEQDLNEAIKPYKGIDRVSLGDDENEAVGLIVRSYLNIISATEYVWAEIKFQKGQNVNTTSD